MSALERLDRLVMRVEAALLSFAILAIAAVQGANVIARNVFGSSLAAAEELSQAASIVLTFVGIGYAARLGRHIRMSALSDALPRDWRGRLERGMHAGTALLLGTLAFHAVRYVADVAAVGSVTPALRLPLAVLYAAVPIGLGLGALQYAVASVRGDPAQAAPGEPGA